jgi:hypothetical protein
VVTSAPERCIEARLLETSIQAVRDGEVSLGVVVEAGHCANIANKVEDDLVEGKDDYEAPPNATKVVLNINVLQSSGRIFTVSASCTLR